MGKVWEPKHDRIAKCYKIETHWSYLKKKEGYTGSRTRKQLEMASHLG